MPLVRAILNALKRELAEAGEVGSLDTRASPHEPQTAPQIAPQQSDVAEKLEAYWDDVRGRWLGPALVQKREGRPS